MKKKENTHTLNEYVAGKTIKNGIKLSSNESAFPLTNIVKKSLIQSLKNTHRYPDTKQRELKQAITKWHTLVNNNKTVGHIGEENVILGNGSDEVLFFIGSQLLKKDDEVVMLQSTFSIYSMVSALAGAKITYVKNFEAFTNISFLEKYISVKTKMVFVCSPNNPTGTAYTAKEFYSFASKLPKNTYLVFDTAYMDFAEPAYKIDIKKLFLLHKNTIVLHTFSKLFALAGLRIGYGLSSSSIIKKLAVVKMPFNINSFASVAALTALKQKTLYNTQVSYIKQERKQMLDFFIKYNIRFFESQANFFCIDGTSLFKKYKNKTNGPPKKISETLYNVFAKNKISIRTLTSFGMPNYVRISLGKKTHNKKVRVVLKKIL